MKTIKSILTAIIFISGTFIFSQETEKTPKEDVKSYYQKRANEDAKFEQNFKGTSKSEEQKFWKEQKHYEEDLKEKDRIAYEAYMNGKRDAYKEHQDHCNNHCHHSRYYHSHVDFYYQVFYNQERRSYRRSTGTRLQIRTPSVSLGIF
jgi:uncharacterized protein YxeA